MHIDVPAPWPPSEDDVLVLPGHDSRRLACGLKCCSSPECACPGVDLFVVPIDDRVGGVEVVGDRLRFVGHDLEDGTPAVAAGEAETVWMDFETGELFDGDDNSVEPVSGSTLESLRAAADGRFLDELARRSTRAKGRVVRDGEPLEESADEYWKPGDILGWMFAFEQTRVDAYVVDGVKYDVDDMYCVDPKCSCNEVVVAFTADLNADADQLPQGAVNVDVDTGEVEIRPSGIDRKKLEVLWARFEERHHGIGILQERHEKMRRRGPELNDRWRAAHAPRAKKTRVGRNDPCPCGSGKKYKRCCLAKESASPST